MDHRYFIKRSYMLETITFLHNYIPKHYEKNIFSYFYGLFISVLSSACITQTTPELSGVKASYS